MTNIIMLLFLLFLSYVAVWSKLDSFGKNLSISPLLIKKSKLITQMKEFDALLFFLLQFNWDFYYFFV